MEIPTWLYTVEIAFITLVTTRYIQLKSVTIRRSKLGMFRRRRN